MEADRKFKAMGTNVHLVINGQDKHLTYACDRLEELEKKWSRFLPYSEITGLNNSEGEPFEVSPETAALISNAIEGVEITKGAFNPTILGDLIRLGYEDSFDKIDDSKTTDSQFNTSTQGITLEGNVVTLEKGVGFDPGGIGKGFAADLIANELMNSGALGVLINIGGDVRLVGVPFRGDGWQVAITDTDGSIVETIAVDEGAIATSTTKKRTWDHNGTRVNHLIDPSSGENPVSNRVLASVIAAQGWQAEILTKVLLIDETEVAFSLLESLSAQGLVMLDSGDTLTTSGWNVFSIK